MDMGKRLKELRIEGHYTQADISILTGIPRGTIAMYETGERTPSLKKAMIFAKLYKVSIDYLCGITENRSLPKEEINV